MKAIDDSLQGDDEFTARKLKTKLSTRFVNLPDVSLSKIKFRQKEFRMGLHTSTLLPIDQGNKQREEEEMVPTTA